MRSYLEENPPDSTVIGGQLALIAWFPEYETFGTCNREKDGQIVEVFSIDVHGQSNDRNLGRLTLSRTYSGRSVGPLVPVNWCN